MSGPQTTVAAPRTAAATEAAAQAHAERAIDDPAKLAWAARVMRTAIARGRATVKDVTADDEAA